MSDLIERLRKTAAARAKATAHDDPNNYLLVVARLSREDADLMAEAAAEIERLRDALVNYRSTLCEGFCGEDQWSDEGHHHPDLQRDCGGCLAASVLLKTAALAQTPTDPGDGWTWNERLGWIGPDGKPADPRRRG